MMNAEGPDAPGHPDMNEPPDVLPSTRIHDTSLDSPEIPQQPQVIEMNAGDDGDLPPTLEMRRKRRAGPVADDEGDPEASPASIITSLPPNHTVQSGFKRKFNPDEDEKLAVISPSGDDFEFNRAVRASLAPNEGTGHGNRSPLKRKIQGRQGPRNHEQPKRKVLEPSRLKFHRICLDLLTIFNQRAQISASVLGDLAIGSSIKCRTLMRKGIPKQLMIVAQRRTIDLVRSLRILETYWRTRCMRKVPLSVRRHYRMRHAHLQYLRLPNHRKPEPNSTYRTLHPAARDVRRLL